MNRAEELPFLLMLLLLLPSQLPSLMWSFSSDSPSMLSHRESRGLWLRDALREFQNAGSVEFDDVTLFTKLDTSMLCLRIGGRGTGELARLFEPLPLPKMDGSLSSSPSSHTMLEFEPRRLMSSSPALARGIQGSELKKRERGGGGREGLNKRGGKSGKGKRNTNEKGEKQS